MRLLRHRLQEWSLQQRNFEKDLNLAALDAVID